MPRILDSLRTQLVLLIIAALAVAQAASLWLFVDERGLAVRAALGTEAAGRAANVALLIEEAPAQLTASILAAANSPLVRFELSDAPAVDQASDAAGGGVAERVRALLGESGDREVRVELNEVGDAMPPMPHLSPEMGRMHLAMTQGRLSTMEMQLSISLANGQWLNVDTRFERPPLQWRWSSTVSFSLTAAVLLIAACWFLLTRLTGPLRRISKAAEYLGRGEDVAPLRSIGPREVRELTDTFNRMQDRISRFVADRTRVLAALGHDLRSPLTALRVRSELVEDEETRESLVTSIEEMQEMVEATLAFARGTAVSETYETVNMARFLAQLRTDMLDVFELENGDGFEIRLRGNSIRRALRNIIENAVRYAGGVSVSYRRDDENALIVVSDNGPGIPDADHERIFEPFFRLEKSRSRETGGTGLGLSIARTIVRAHGGDVILANRPQGGLSVTITLPLDKQGKPQERKTT